MAETCAFKGADFTNVPICLLTQLQLACRHGKAIVVKALCDPPLPQLDVNGTLRGHPGSQLRRGPPNEPMGATAMHVAAFGGSVAVSQSSSFGCANSRLCRGSSLWHLAPRLHRIRAGACCSSSDSSSSSLSSSSEPDADDFV